jgi:hypothetical protein
MSISFSNLLTPNNLPVNQRAVIDNNFVQVAGLNANAAAATNTGSIDLQQAVPYPVTEIVNVQVGLSSVSNLMGPANNASINAVLQVSSDNSNWANSTVFATPLLSVAAANNSTFPGGTVNIKLDPGSSRYIRAQFAGQATGGTYNGTINGTIQLLF